MLVCQTFHDDSEDIRAFKETKGVKIIELTSDGEILTMYDLNVDSGEANEVDYILNHAG